MMFAWDESTLNRPQDAKLGLFFCLFSFFSHEKYSKNWTVNDKSVDGVLGTRTRSGRMEVANF